VLTLAKEGLLTTLGYVGGHWRPAADGATFDVVNPADGGVVARVADYGAPTKQRTP
jgi:succinate-semialdehyde dehydrogenase/glutarate-semialdehyde dehydrogenase